MSTPTEGVLDPSSGASAKQAGDERTEAERAAHRRRWLGLVVIAIAQLTIVVDATIVNVALPAMTVDLDISESGRAWVLTAYTLAFGGFLLLGGRIADYFGLRRTFCVGLIGFGVASAIAGAAPNFEILLASRAAQGLFGAIMAPASLALLATTFKDPKERAKAFAIFGAVAGGGSAIGLVLGGALTQYLNWRWTMFVNIPITVFAVVGALALLDEFKPAHPGRLDILGTVLGTGGLVSLVYGVSEAERNGWTEPLTLFLFGFGISLLIVFVLSQRMVANPVLPMRVLANRTRAGANIAVLLASVALMGAFFWQTFFMQGVLGYSPLMTGVGFLAVTAGIVVASAIVSVLVTKVQPRIIMGVGLVGAAVSSALLMRIGLESTYWKDLFPALILMGLSLGGVFVPAFNAATIDVDPRDASVASAVINTGQQVGGSFGVALISTIAASRTAEWLAAKDAANPQVVLEGLVEGYVRASLWAALILVFAGVIVALLINVKNLDLSAGEAGLPPVYDVESEPGASEPVEVAAAPAPQPTLPPTPAIPAPAASTNGHHPVPAPLPEFPLTERPPAWAAAGGVRPVAGRRDGEGPVPNVLVFVCDTAGQPLGGAVLTLLDGVGRHLDRGWCDEGGHAGFPVAGPAELVLVARHRGYRPAARTVHVPHAGPTAEREVGVTVVLTPAVVLTGTVRASSGRRPLAGALVELTDSTGAVLASTRTDDRGVYHLSDLAPGVRTLVVTPDREAPITTRVELGSAGSLVHDVSAFGRTGVVGIARTPEGAPLPDAMVWVSDDSGHVVAQTRTDAGGQYSLLDLPAGSYTLSAVGYPPATTEVVVTDGADVEAILTLRHVDATGSSI
ncbi:MAG: MFS transporter [Sporichthyaceae bacterium]